MDKKKVTEADFRKPEFVDASPEDYEFRADGAVVRKDRWERGIRDIGNILGWARKEFEVSDIVDEVRKHVPICGAGIVGCTGGPKCGSSHK